MRLDTGNAFSLISYVICAGMVLVALGVFGYSWYLGTVRDAKAEEIASAQQKVDDAKIQGFFRLRDRLSSSRTLLDNHVTLSAFFDVLEQLTLQNVRFTSFRLTTSDSQEVTIELGGVARTFNALASEAAKVGSHPDIKQATFSNIATDKDGTVTFTLAARLDRKIVTGNYKTGSSSSLGPLSASSTPELFVPSGQGTPTTP